MSWLRGLLDLVLVIRLLLIAQNSLQLPGAVLFRRQPAIHFFRSDVDYAPVVAGRCDFR
jgi:hypothetical protein